MATGGTTIDDRVWRELMGRVKGLGRGPSVKVGIVGDAAEEPHDDEEGGEITNAELGALFELGTRDMPARSWLVRTFDLKRDELRAMQLKAAKALFNLGSRVTVEEELGKIGAWAAGALRATITQQMVVPKLEDSPAGRRTIARKGSSVTLVDTAQFVNSITWVMSRSSEED